MLRPICLALCITLVPLSFMSAQDRPAASGGNKEGGAIEEVFRLYSAAFNKRDAKAVAANWAPQGVYADRETGERTQGREAIQADFESLFKDRPGVHLTLNVDNVRLIKPDVAMADGKAVVFVADEEPNETSFSAILVQQGGQWLIDTAIETDVAVPLTSYDGLKDLEWMVGHWVDESDSVLVDTVVRWSANRSFLVRSFTVQPPDDESFEGTQIIGWDPAAKQIRSWTFNSDGSFGEATWSKHDDSWMAKTSQTLADGRMASGTQVITHVDDNTITVQTVGQEIDGEPAPAAEPVKVVRLPATEPSEQGGEPALAR